jgi:hypothetical protein
MMVQTRRKNKAVVSSTGISVETVYCRKCRQNKSPAEFYSAVDRVLDTNGYLSLCKLCCRDIYDGFYLSEKSIERAMLKTCRLLNLRYDENAIEAAKQQVETMKARGTESDNFFGLYKSRLLTSQPACIQSDRSGIDLTFQEPTVFPEPVNVLEETEENYDLVKVWGEDLNEEDYSYLEEEFSEWTRTHKCDTKAEKTLLREICHKSLEIRKKRKESRGSTPANLIKELQDLMKTASVDPSKSSEANSGKGKETFSNFVKIIEENDPAEYYKDKKLFKDFDNIDFYFKKYVTRPLKNFITQSRDFNVDTEDDMDETVDVEPKEDGDLT